MLEKPSLTRFKQRVGFSQEIGARAARKLKARRNAGRGVWFGLGMMGIVGWSIVIPTLLGAALGIWLDKRNPGIHSWTLTLILVGLALGCVNAWHWVSKESKNMEEDQDDE